MTNTATRLNGANHIALSSTPIVEQVTLCDGERTLRDSKGRAFGICIMTWQETIAAGDDPRGDHRNKRREPGVYYLVNAQVTRDGRSYGASQGSEAFTTEAGREAYIARRTKQARTRALKG